MHMWPSSLELPPTGLYTTPKLLNAYAGIHCTTSLTGGVLNTYRYV
jgi:hypothetical protein